MVSADNSGISHVKYFEFNNDSLSGFPPDLAFVVSNSQMSHMKRVKSSGGGLLDVTNVKHVSYRNPGNSNKAILEDDSDGIQRIELVAKGDFNKDGVEDLMVAVDNMIKGAHYHAIGLYVLTRLKKNGRYELVKKFPIM